MALALAIVCTGLVVQESLLGGDGGTGCLVAALLLAISMPLVGAGADTLAIRTVFPFVGIAVVCVIIDAALQSDAPAEVKDIAASITDGVFAACLLPVSLLSVAASNARERVRFTEVLRTEQSRGMLAQSYRFLRRASITASPRVDTARGLLAPSASAASTSNMVPSAGSDDPVPAGLAALLVDPRAQAAAGSGTTAEHGTIISKGGMHGMVVHVSGAPLPTSEFGPGAEITAEDMALSPMELALRRLRAVAAEHPGLREHIDDLLQIVLESSARGTTDGRGSGGWAPGTGGKRGVGEALEAAVRGTL